MYIPFIGFWISHLFHNHSFCCMTIIYIWFIEIGYVVSLSDVNNIRKYKYYWRSSTFPRTFHLPAGLSKLRPVKLIGFINRNDNFTVALTESIGLKGRVRNKFVTNEFVFAKTIAFSHAPAICLWPDDVKVTWPPKFPSNSWFTK